MSDEEAHARTREGMQEYFSRPEIAARFQEACARAENTDPMEQLRAGLKALLAECPKWAELAESMPGPDIGIAGVWIAAQDAMEFCDTYALRRGIADTHEVRVNPWSVSALGTDTAAEAENASEQAHSPVSGDCGSEGTR